MITHNCKYDPLSTGCDAIPPMVLSPQRPLRLASLALYLNVILGMSLWFRIRRSHTAQDGTTALSATGRAPSTRSSSGIVVALSRFAVSTLKTLSPLGTRLVVSLRAVTRAALASRVPTQSVAVLMSAEQISGLALPPMFAPIAGRRRTNTQPRFSSCIFDILFPLCFLGRTVLLCLIALYCVEASRRRGLLLACSITVLLLFLSHMLTFTSRLQL